MDGEFDASRLGAYLQSHPVGYRPSGSAPAHRVRFQLTLKPRVRCGPLHQSLGRSALRAHPAGAASTSSASTTIPPTGSPPRAREHGTTSSATCWAMGSSHELGERLSGVRRTTPHRAHPHGRGEHVAGSIGERTRRAHPRERGEHAGKGQVMIDPQGSSPQARGARGDHRARSAHTGFIPAGAGSTHHHGAYGVVGAGSSPQARGAHLLTSTYSAGRAGFHSLS